jgi:hypothetical protein
VTGGVGYSAITWFTIGKLVAIYMNLSSIEEDTAFEATPSFAPTVSKSSMYSDSRFFESLT